MRDRRLLLIVMLAGYGLRILLLDRFPFREDEAIYSYWALYGWHEDPYFLTVWPDKPPLFIWILGVAYRLFGIEAASARMVNIAASTLTIPVVAVTARRLWGERAALLTAVAMALSPFAISFAPTAFVDPLLVLFGCLALYFAVADRPVAAGIFLGAAIMTKQQGLLYLPLILLALITVPHRDIAATLRRSKLPQWRPSLRRGMIFLVGLALLVLPIVYWDSRRWAVAPSPWDLSVRNYAALTVLAPSDWLQRLNEWQTLLWHLTANNLVWLAILILAIALASMGASSVIRSRSSDWRLSKIERASAEFASPCHVADGAMAIPLHLVERDAEPPTRRRSRERQDHSQTSDLCGRHVTEVRPAGNRTYMMALLLLWSSGFLLFHIITSVQVWDRYLLPLAPMLALLVGGGATQALRGWGECVISPASPRIGSRGADNRLSRFTYAGVIVTFTLLLTLPAWYAATGKLAIGGDHGAYDGLDEAVAWVEAQDEDAVLYHDVLGWHYRFYLYESSRHGAVDLRWFPSSTYLADNAEKTPHLRKFYVAPVWAAHANLTQRMKMRGLAFTSRTTYGHFTVYEMSSTRVLSCEWCLCTDDAIASEWRTGPLAGPISYADFASGQSPSEPAP